MIHHQKGDRKKHRVKGAERQEPVFWSSWKKTERLGPWWGPHVPHGTKNALTGISSSVLAANCVMGLWGITKMCFGASGLTSQKAIACKAKQYFPS